MIANVPKIIALAILPTVFSGKHTRLPGVHIFRCKKAEVHSKIALPVHSDGEPIYLQKDVSFSLEPETLKIITYHIYSVQFYKLFDCGVSRLPSEYGTDSGSARRKDCRHLQVYKK